MDQRPKKEINGPLLSLLLILTVFLSRFSCGCDLDQDVNTLKFRSPGTSQGCCS